MQYRHIYLLLTIFLFIHAKVSGQEIDNTSSYKNIYSDNYVRLYMDNDFFTGSDEQYTAGVSFEIATPVLKNFFLSKLLIHPRYRFITYGFGLRQADYTPHDLTSYVIDKGDRPYASTLFLTTFLIATDAVHKQRFATTLCTGVMGNIALGGQLQSAIHDALDFITPEGWKYYIHNDVVLNYQVNYQKQLLSYRHLLSLDAEGMARAGTLSDKQGLGIDLMLGFFESPFTYKNVTTSKFHIYLYDNPEVDVAEYDATLEGGMFNHSSPYTIPAANVSPVTFMNRAGIVMTYKSIYLEYNECFLTKQFSTGTQHLWGGIEIAKRF